MEARGALQEFPEILKPGIPHHGADGHHTFPKSSQITRVVDDAVHELCGGSLREGREIMPFTTHVHHSFVDAVHVGKLVNRLQEYLLSV